MNVIICGSRNVKLTGEEIDDIVTGSGFRITQLVCGMAVGIDSSAESWAIDKGIPVIEKPFLRGSKAGGHIRNQNMVDIADAWIGIIDGRWTTGTRDCYSRASKAKLPIYLINMSGI